MERTIESRSEHPDRKDNLKPKERFTDSDNDYNAPEVDDRFPQSDPEHNFIPVNEIPDSDKTEDLFLSTQEEPETLEKITRKRDGFMRDGKFVSTEPCRVGDPSTGKETLITRSKRMSLKERKRLLMRLIKRHHSEKNKAERLNL